MPTLAELRGLWRRSLLVSPRGSDATTHVLWLQSLTAFIDLRQPHPPHDFSHVGALCDLSLEDCAWLARQEGFAGELRQDGEFFEWSRRIDYQPAATSPDAGSLQWDGACLVERGRYAEYVEHWHRATDGAHAPLASFTLRAPRRGTHAAAPGTHASLVRVGSHFMWARDRAVALPAAASLADCIAAADSLDTARHWLDCEISYGVSEPHRCRISRSTLPFRIGTALQFERAGDILRVHEWRSAATAITHEWDIIAAEDQK